MKGIVYKQISRARQPACAKERQIKRAEPEGPAPFPRYSTAYSGKSTLFKHSVVRPPRLPAGALGRIDFVLGLVIQAVAFCVLGLDQLGGQPAQ
jgi:hypothetical protein